MLSTILTNLQTLISTRIVLGSFFPSLGFWFANAAMLYLLNNPFQFFVRANIAETAGLSAILAVAALIAVAMFSYVLSAVLPAFQSILEGNWPAWITHLFTPAQMRGLQEIESQLDRNRNLLGSLSTIPTGQTQAEAWRKTLLTARVAGITTGVNTYTTNLPSALAIRHLWLRRKAGRTISADDLSSSVTLLSFDLRANNADKRGPDGDYSLDAMQTHLTALIDYAEAYAIAEDRRLATTRNFRFGALPLSPTRMGNVARTVQNYTVQRYNLNFELFWSRLQLPVQRDKDFGPVLQSAKAQLDFLISSSVLTFTWTVVWMAALWLTSGPEWLFLVIALAGPALAYVWYRAAVAHYQTFADLLRSATDLFRFELLSALHYPRPDGVGQERELWETLDRLHLFFETRDFRYVDVEPKPQ